MLDTTKYKMCVSLKVIKKMYAYIKQINQIL